MRKDKEQAANYQNVRRTHWDEVARKKDNWASLGGYYHRRLAQIYHSWSPLDSECSRLAVGWGIYLLR